MRCRFALALLVVVPLAGCGASPEPSAQAALPVVTATSGPVVNADATVLAEFKDRVEKYAQLRDTLVEQSLPLKKTDDPAGITAAEQSLAVKIRQARPGAKQGEFFTPATVESFRRMMKPALKGPEGTENRNAIKDDVPESVPLVINGDYPKLQTVSTVAPDVLSSLPGLPDNVQYRFVGKHFILYDARANTVIDYFLNAIS